MSVREDKSSNTVSKAFAVLRCFIDGQEEWGVRELAAVIRQPTSSVHRLLKILRREGYLEFDPAVQRYRVGLELVRVASVIRPVSLRAFEAVATLTPATRATS